MFSEIINNNIYLFIGSHAWSKYNEVWMEGLLLCVREKGRRPVDQSCKHRLVKWMMEMRAGRIAGGRT